MNSKCLPRILYKLVTGILLLTPGVVYAGCREYSFESAAGSFSYTYICTSAFDTPRYTIIRNFTEADDLQVFEFAPREIGLICERYSSNVGMRGDCRMRKPVIGAVFETRIGSFRVHALDESGELAFSRSLANGPLVAYPDNTELMKGASCAVTAGAGGNVDIWLGLDPLALSECLIHLEKGLSKHPGFFYRH